MLVPLRNSFQPVGTHSSISLTDSTILAKIRYPSSASYNLSDNSKMSTAEELEKRRTRPSTLPSKHITHPLKTSLSLTALQVQHSLIYSVPVAKSAITIPTTVVTSVKRSAATVADSAIPILNAGKTTNENEDNNRNGLKRNPKTTTSD